MSLNASRDTKGMQPSPSQGVLGAEDVRGLALARRIFPRLASALALVLWARPPSLRSSPANPMRIDGQASYELKVSTNSGEAWNTRAANCVQNRIEPSQGGKFLPSSMWHSAERPNGLADIVVTFPIPVGLTAVGVHSQHSGQYNAADFLRVEIDTRDGFQFVAGSPLQAPDRLVPLPRHRPRKHGGSGSTPRTTGALHSAASSFLTGTARNLPPPVPSDGDSRFADRAVQPAEPLLGTWGRNQEDPVRPSEPRGFSRSLCPVR